jgi:hypothetical protein
MKIILNQPVEWIRSVQMLAEELWGDSKLLDRLLNFDKDNIPGDAWRSVLESLGHCSLCVFIYGGVLK